MQAVVALRNPEPHEDSLGQARLIITAGLPGSGKSSVAEGVARALRAPLLSIDPIEAALWRAQISQSATGIAAYVVAEALAEENIALGASVVADAVNPVEAARAGWRRLARRRNVPLTIVECICSDAAIHRQRVEARVRGIAGMPELTWDRVEERRAEYQPWTDDRIVLDTSAEPLGDLVARTLRLSGEL